MALQPRQWQKFDEEGKLNPEAEAAARRDGVLLFIGRSVRMFSYGSLTVVLLQYLEGLGLSDNAIGALLTVILLGDLGVSLWLTSRADNLGRRHCLLVGAVLKIFAGAAFALASPDYTWVLFPAGVIGVVSSTGGEIGPFLPIEQAALIQARSDAEPASLFAWYGAAGYLSQVPRPCFTTVSQPIVSSTVQHHRVPLHAGS
jgi:MFS family permease